MTRKKVMIFANEMLSFLNFRAELVSSLCKQYDVVIAAPDSSSHKEDFPEVMFIDIENMKRRSFGIINNFKLYFEYRKYVKKVKPDLILTYTIKPNIFVGLYTKYKKIPVVVTITGLGSLFYNGKLKRFIGLTLYKFCCSKSESIVFQNKHNQKMFSDFRIASNKHVIVNGSGVNIDAFPYTEKKESNEVNFLFIGRLMKEKGLDELLYCIDSILSKYDFVKFIIIGSYEEDYTSEIESLAIKYNNFEYKGYQEDVHQFITECDALINPSHHEGLSNVILESAAMGRPVIASNIPGCKEAVINNETGLLFEVSNKEALVSTIEKFLDTSPNERTTMGLKARKFVEREFKRSEVVNKYIGVIKDII